MSSTDGQTFTVYIDDNYDFMDKDARYKGGDFKTFEEAVAFCKTIVDEFLLGSLKKEPTQTAEALYSGYKGYGEDPFISGDKPRWSSWEYAEERCKILCAPTPPTK